MARGKEFTDRRFGLRRRAATGNHEFARLCAEVDIEHCLAPPMRPQTNGMVGRFNGRIEDILQSHRFRSGEDWEQTILRHVRLYSGQLPQSVPNSRTPIDAIKDWHRERPELFRKRPYIHAGCDKYSIFFDDHCMREIGSPHYDCKVTQLAAGVGSKAKGPAAFSEHIIYESSKRSDPEHL